MTIGQQTEYETVMRTELDIIAEKNYARDTGREEGRAEGLKTAITAMLELGLPTDEVQQRLKLSDEQWKRIQASY